VRPGRGLSYAWVTGVYRRTRDRCLVPDALFSGVQCSTLLRRGGRAMYEFTSPPGMRSGDFRYCEYADLGRK